MQLYVEATNLMLLDFAGVQKTTCGVKLLKLMENGVGNTTSVLLCVQKVVNTASMFYIQLSSGSTPSTLKVVSSTQTV